MSWNINLSGHKDDQDQEQFEQLAREVGRIARDADVGLTYVSVGTQNGSKSLPIDELDEAEEDDESDDSG